jgi:hypothetical protein
MSICQVPPLVLRAAASSAESSLQQHAQGGGVLIVDGLPGLVAVMRPGELGHGRGR